MWGIIFLIFLGSSVHDAIGIDGGFRQVALDLHNDYRAAVGSSPLELSSELNIVAHARAERLAASKSFEATGGREENLWAHFGELRPLNVNTRDATKTWFTGTPVPPESTIFTINTNVLYSNSTKYLGIGVGTNEDSYTIVIAYYL